MEREYSYHQQEQPFLTLVPLRQPLDEIKIESFSAVDQEVKKRATYTLGYDVDAYRKIQVFRYSDPERYQAEKNILDNLTRFNQITMLGERLNASISDRVDIVDPEGVMRDRITNRPLIEWYEEGVRESKRLGSSPHDQLREAAEVIGQKKIEEKLNKVGKMMLSISPAGGEDSMYQKNFYDASRRVSETEIEVVRFMSSLSIEEAMTKLAAIGISVPEHTPTDVQLLANPFEIGEDVQYRTPDELHDYLHEHISDSLSRQEMQIVINECSPLINRYLIVVENAPYETDLLKKAYNAIVNKADQVVDMLKSGSYNLLSGADNSESVATLGDMFFLGSQTVREVDTGCGLSAGFAFGNNARFSVLDFAVSRTDERDQFESRYFTCPVCRKENKRPYGLLIPNCQKCGADVSCGPEDKVAKQKRLWEQEWEQKQEQRLLDFEQKQKEKKKDEQGVLLYLFQPAPEKEEEKQAA